MYDSNSENEMLEMVGQVLIRCFADKTISLMKNQIVSFRGKDVWINCSSGSLYITWPKCNERTLVQGDCIFIPERGKVCVIAFSDATFRIRQIRRFYGVFKMLTMASRFFHSIYTGRFGGSSRSHSPDLLNALDDDARKWSALPMVKELKEQERRWKHYVESSSI